MSLDHTVYHAQNRCSCTGLERLVRVFTWTDGRIFRVYRDNFSQYRIVSFKSLAHAVGYAGLVLGSDGYIKHKEVCPAMRHGPPYVVMVALLRSLKIVVRDA